MKTCATRAYSRLRMIRAVHTPTPPCVPFAARRCLAADGGQFSGTLAPTRAAAHRHHTVTSRCQRPSVSAGDPLLHAGRSRRGSAVRLPAMPVTSAPCQGRTRCGTWDRQLPSGPDNTDTGGPGSPESPKSHSDTASISLTFAFAFTFSIPFTCTLVFPPHAANLVQQICEQTSSTTLARSPSPSRPVLCNPTLLQLTASSPTFSSPNRQPTCQSPSARVSARHNSLRRDRFAPPPRHAYRRYLTAIRRSPLPCPMHCHALQGIRHPHVADVPVRAGAACATTASVAAMHAGRWSCRRSRSAAGSECTWTAAAGRLRRRCRTERLSTSPSTPPSSSQTAYTPPPPPESRPTPPMTPARSTSPSPRRVSLSCETATSASHARCAPPPPSPPVGSLSMLSP